ncbi:uncharacterized protein LOC128546312 [Mercenaria mercenaria]|uniref:uncharacterized protein LOC128546312 n=1 Tax=Mercenaria mercenaria TaxID=6596 RepID=UPI00234F67EE|nr:uncharacterized protein LOC128546312 [Mercenaria mercenaria]
MQPQQQNKVIKRINNTLHLQKKKRSDISEKYVAVNASIKENLIQNARIRVAERTIDGLLTKSSLTRVKVPGHGNCFFEASIKSSGSNKTAEELRELLSEHLEENSEDYACFLLNKHKPDDDEVFLNEYLNEQILRRNVLSFIQTKIQPNLVEPAPSDIINLAYISIPGLIEHYDACTVDNNIDTQNQSVNEENANEHNIDKLVATLLNKKVNGTPRKSTPLNENVSATPRKSTPLNKNVNATPRKPANYNTPVKRHLVRKRKTTPENWKRNIKTKLRLSGKQYISKSGKVITMVRRRHPYHVSWIQIRHMRFVKDLPDTMLFKHDLRDDFTAIKTAKDVKLNEVVPNKYRQKLPVSAAKKKDLITLCKNGAIPKDYDVLSITKTYHQVPQ